MHKLGLIEHMPLSTLIEMAAKSSKDQRLSILNYFCDNFQTFYKADYNSMYVSTAFLPTKKGDSLAKPKECYAEPGCSILGCLILVPELKMHAEKFGVDSHPTSKVILTLLQTNPPSSDDAIPVFAYLSSRQFDFDRNDWSNLRSLKFIPVKNEKGQDVWMSPSTVYFGKGDSKVYGSQFTYVDFGPTCNAFLSACGVKDEPTPAELASMLVKTPDHFLNTMGVESYLGLLRQLAAHYSLLKNDKSLYRDMKNRPFLLGLKSTSNTGSDGKSGGDSLTSRATQYKLAKASDIYLIDDTVLGQLFNPLGAPIEAIIESMYQDLGSPWLSQQVKEVTSPLGKEYISQRSQTLEQTIHERALLLLYDGQQMRSSKDIHPHAEPCLKSLQVVEVPSIEISRTFEGVTKKQKTTACLLANRNTKTFFLFISGDFDYFDVATALGRIIFKQCRLNDALLLSTLLSTSLENLKRKGFPVDRILNLKQTLELAQQIQEEARSKQALQRRESDETALTHSSRKSSHSNLNETGSKELMTSKSSNKELPPPPPTLTNDGLGGSSGGGGVLDMFNRFSGNVMKNLGISPNENSTVKSPGGWPSSELQQPSAPNTTQRNITPSSTSQVQSQLSRSIRNLASIQDTRFRAQIPADPEPSQIPTPQSQQNPCRIIADSDLAHVQTIQGIMFYVDKRLGDTKSSEILDQNLQGLLDFSMVLHFLSTVFQISTQAVGMYWDLTGDTIAFNRNKTLFFNAKYYIGLHYPKRRNNSEDPATFYYWYMTFCHELAHGFVGAHDAQHEFWMSSFAQEYMGTLIQKLKEIGLH